MRTLNLGLSYWGICASFDDHRFEISDTPDGHRFGRPIFIDAMVSRGHRVIALQNMREHVPYKQLMYADPRSFPDIDVLFIEWRWSTYRNDRNHPNFSEAHMEPDLERQRALIEHYRTKCPIIAWDTDLKITVDDELRWPELIVADPSLFPRKLTRDRSSLPFWSDWRAKSLSCSPYPLYIYVGNRYERDAEFEEFYYKPAETLRALGVQTAMYGNWLQKSPERSDPAILIAGNPNVAFNHRMNFNDSMMMMNRAMCTTHVSKQKYYDDGFISPRFLEAVAMGCPALVPAAHKYAAEIMGTDSIVRSANDVVSAVADVSRWSLAQRAEFLQMQERKLRSAGCFDVSNAVTFIENITCV